MAKGIGDVIYSLLSNSTDVTDIVSTRIYPFLAIEDVVYPYLVYTIENVDPTVSNCGASSLDTVSVNLEIYTETLAELEDLGDKVRNALDRYKGTTEGVEVQIIAYQNEDYGYADEDRVYLKIQSYNSRLLTISAYFNRVTDLVANGYSDSQIDLTWSDVATGETGYEVWSSSDFISWTLIATTAADAVSYSNSGLTAETPYAYKIRAVDTDDKGVWSNIALGSTESIIVVTPFKIDHSFLFDGVNEHFDNTNDLAYINSILSGTDKAWTIKIGLNFSNIGLNEYIFSDSGGKISIRKTSANIIQVILRSGGAFKFSSSTLSITDNNFHELCVTYDGTLSLGSRCKIYLDSVITTTTDNTTNIVDSGTVGFSIASRYGNANELLGGYVQQLSIIDIPLTQLQITDSYNSGEPKDSSVEFTTNCKLYLNADISNSDAPFVWYDPINSIDFNSINMEDSDKTTVTPYI